MNLSDFVIDFLVKKGIKDIFLVSGGGIMYLCDAVGRNKKINYISNYHEQACAIAAEGYARIKNSVGACLVTTGPGSTNTLTGVAGAFVESIPIIIISGQVKRETIADYSKLRQLGVQEINIIDMVKPVTKYAKTIMDPETIGYELEKAWYLATEGRPGPVWINLPLDVQAYSLDPKKLKHFSPPVKNQKQKNELKKQVAKFIELLKKSERPVLITGYGIRLAKGEKLLEELLHKIKIPVVHNINGLDLVPEDYPLNMGMFGPAGNRRANFAIQNADLIIAVGASLDINETGFNFKDFGRKANKITVNIDKEELLKPNVFVDLAITEDAKAFFEEFLQQTKNVKFNFSPKWFAVCKMWKQKYPTIITDFFKDKNYVHSYVFMDRLSDFLSLKDVLTTGIGQDIVSFYQAFKVKKNQRAFANKHFGGMGWCLPLAIGANIGNNRHRSICVTGDGSIQFNIQELNTIRYYELPIKIFVYNNRGYKSIRDTQNNLFAGRLVGADSTSGVLNPDFKKLADTYSFTYEKIMNNQEINRKIKKVLSIKGPVLCEVNINPNQERIPRSVTYRDAKGQLKSRPLEDLAPLLPREELEENMSLFNKP